MRIAELSAVPFSASIVANWYHSEWGHMHPSSSAKAIELKLNSQFESHTLPHCYVAISEENQIIGAAELKFREVAALPQYEHWLGGVYVEKSNRGRGVASELVRHVTKVAHKQFHVVDLYLQTEQSDGGLYAHLGWRELLRRSHEGRERVIMVRNLSR